ncbi:UDP-N-acetylmuramate--L-alanine ligase [Arboricoccus pini]|uniref:UDP-N-acetylmuramate--L-alanine ligase n=1 Tax=Arboricoccus pini TaxID=1963835 RepID=A0A212QAA8_9PROT|nr:UDP-N-acetylmuramate--L-alanine ligase [Arboricoccus pini]SNB56296.1 UDP-N-acetylmuramate--L-alanine ligase [Arboricoccus pini]
MSFMPLEIGPIHFIGIGGIGMSGIAEILVSLGYRVQGSDASENANVQRLRQLGIEVKIGQQAENLSEAGVVVVSTAIKPGNPELERARQLRLPVVRRADMLGELMRFKRGVAVSGTHGKTTTTAMVAAVLDAAGRDPTVVNGGIINAWGTNARLGKGDWMVVESDESDGSFLRLPATIGVVTNIDPEHMDYWASFDAVRDAYQTFIERLPFYGLGVLCIDHPEVQALMARITDRRVVTYGFSPQADIQASEPVFDDGAMVFDITFRDREGRIQRRLEGMRLALPGRHNVANALAAIAVGRELGIGELPMRKALAGLEGVRRRFTRTGLVDGIAIIDDYGHHPVEIKAVLDTARRAAKGRVLAVVQPHRYTRLRDLFDEFCTAFINADAVIVAPVYPAGEAPIPGVDAAALVAGLKQHGQREVLQIEGPEELAALVDGMARMGDYVVFLGAGSISQWANALPAELEARRRREGAA